MTNRKLISLDLAKSVIQVEVEDQKQSKIISNKKMTVKRLRTFLAKQAPATIAMEACSSAHHWCWYAEEFGHEVILLPPHHVAPYRQGHKTDETDVQAVREAAKRPDCKQAVKKTPELLQLQMFLKVRGRYVDHKRQLSNQIRMHLLEFGIRIPKSYAALQRELMPILEDAENGLMDLTRSLLHRLCQSYLQASTALKELEVELRHFVNTIEPCRRLSKLEGVGPVCALLIYICIGDGSAFKNGKEAAALIGVTPQQHSTGGVANIGHIRKIGVDKQARAILLQGAKAVVHKKKPGNTKKEIWLRNLIGRRGENVAAVALVNKNIRTAWAMLSRGEEYVAA